MDRFIDWFNGGGHLKGAVRAGVAHLYFEGIHPFVDGNGRIGRAISEIALSQELGRPAPLSLSTAIEERQLDYYSALSKTGRGNLDITEWLVWSADAVQRAQDHAREQTAWTLSKTRFWDAYADRLNSRQTKVATRMFRAEPEGFEGGMSARKYAELASCDEGTAAQDLADLLAMGAVKVKELESAGRWTRYDIQLPER